jgi:hypothetical protein
MQSCITLPMCVCKKNSRSVSACTLRRMNNSAIAHQVTVRVWDNIINVNSFVWTHTVAQTHSKTHRSCHNVHPCMHILCAGIVPMSGSEVKLLAGHCEPAVLLLWDSSAGSVCMHDKVSSVAACVSWENFLLNLALVSVLKWAFSRALPCKFANWLWSKLRASVVRPFFWHRTSFWSYLSGLGGSFLRPENCW